MREDCSSLAFTGEGRSTYTMQTARHAFILLASLICAVVPGGADDPCGRARSQAEAIQCYGAEYKKSDSALKATYDRLSQILSLDGRKWLTKAQTAWIEFRHANCEFVATEYEGGSAAALSRTVCLKVMSDRREAELRDELRKRSSR